MWDSARLLRAAAGFVVGFVTLALLAGGVYWLSHSAFFRLRSIELCSILQHAPREEIEAVLARQAGGNFFAAPIDDLRASLERLPWVRKAGVRRVWPDRLEVTIEEHAALLAFRDERAELVDLCDRHVLRQQSLRLGAQPLDP